MATRPLLIFPHPENAERMNRVGGQSNVHFPSHRQQTQRLGPKFEQLRQAFEGERAQLRQDPGLEPERVLVLETVDGIEEFVRAVRLTPGMEWLCEWEEENIESDEDFYQESDPERSLRGRLYLVMSNQQAMDELIRMWNRYQRSPIQQFARGLNKWRQIFARLRDIRFWDERDRMDRNLLRFWEEQFAGQTQNVGFRAELWFSASPQKRLASQRLVEQLIREEGGRILAQAVIPEIGFHSIAGELPALAARRIANLEQTRLMRCNEVMFFRPLGQSAVPVPGDEPAGPPARREREGPARIEPIIALLDGLPAVNHELLTGRIVLDDPDGWSEEYPAQDRIHGTMMASIIAHGDLAANYPALQTPIYARPIFRPDRPGWRPSPVERIPEGIIPEDLIRRSVVRICLGEGREGPIAPTIRVVCLAIGDPLIGFDRTISPLARVIDWLAWTHNLLFLVSAGNQVNDIELDIPRGTLGHLAPAQIEQATIRAIEADGFNRRLLCPAEAMNALTIGSLHFDSSSMGFLGHRINPFQSDDLPSPISAIGLGYRRSVKPDLLLPGGRQLFAAKLGNTHTHDTLQVLSSSSRAPGQQAASPGPSGDLTATRYYCGTSNATAMAARKAGEMYEVLRELRDERGGDILTDRHTAVILKTMLVHGCSWDGPMAVMEPILQSLPNRPPTREYAPRFLGYGPTNPDRLFSCSEQRATLVGCGTLSEGQAHIYRVPLPPSLSGQRVWRRLTVTMSWLTPINPFDRYYRRAALWFAPPQEDLMIRRRQVDSKMAQRGTVQHEILEGDQATAFVDRSVLTIQVNCRAQSGRLEDDIPYGIAVSLEVAEGTPISIYEEIRARLRVRVPIQPTRGNR